MAGHSVPIMFVPMPISARRREPREAESLRYRIVVMTVSLHMCKPPTLQPIEPRPRFIVILGPQPRVVVPENKDTFTKSHRTRARRGLTRVAAP